LLAILFSTLVGGALVLVSGHNPLHAYAEIVEGSLSLDSLPDTLNWALGPELGGAAHRFFSP